MEAIPEVIELLAENWGTIAKLIGLGVITATGYELTKAVVGSSQAFQSAVSISAYAIPAVVYSMVFQMVFSTIRNLTQTMTQPAKTTS